MKIEFSIEQSENKLIVKGRHYKLEMNRSTGLFDRITMFDGIGWNEILSIGDTVGHNWYLPLDSCKIIEQSDELLKIVTVHQSENWRIVNNYEVYPRGYVVCTFTLKALKNNVGGEPFVVGVSLDEKTVFANAHRVVNTDNNAGDVCFPRAMAVDFSTDDRAVTNSINLLLESSMQNMAGQKCHKMYDNHDGSRFIGYQLGGEQGSFSKGYKYENRWALTLTAMNNSPNKVRGQRIYHWYGLFPQYPTDDLLIEMSEYGCSILAIHMPSFKYISGSEPSDKHKLNHIVGLSHELGMKIIFYIQPYLMSINAPYYKNYKDCLVSEGHLRWDSKAATQIIYYEPHANWDSDELCLRCEKAYDFIYNSVIVCWEKYGFDGLYIDWCWPMQGLCNDLNHGHRTGLFNFYDYLRMIRDWRRAIGDDDVMIGHGGGLLVSSDFVEAYDACLTGEAQQQIDPMSIGQQFGMAPTLWAMHRRKQDVFRSANTVTQLVREGITPHTGLGVMGTSVIATQDPAHHISLLPLWQMWRAFPVEKAKFYNYLTEKVVKLDNHEVFYSLYVADDKRVLLILANGGGPEHDRTPAVSANVRIDIGKLGLLGKMNCWRMKGATYETFRITEVDPVIDGKITVPELGLNEVIGFVLSPDKAPKELITLVKHLEGRSKRLPAILDAKQKRLLEIDKLIDHFAMSPVAANKMKYDEFMKDRVAE